MQLLKEKREALGLSMNMVAKRAKLSHTMVSRVERELRRPTLDTLFRIADAMQVDLWPLIQEAEETEPRPQNPTARVVPISANPAILSPKRKP